jgi:hypothetical protein
MARTGLDTPPGISFLAQSKSRVEESRCMRRATLLGRLIKLASRPVICILYNSLYTGALSASGMLLLLLFTKSIYNINYNPNYISIISQ